MPAELQEEIAAWDRASVTSRNKLRTSTICRCGRGGRAYCMTSLRTWWMR